MTYSAALEIVVSAVDFACKSYKWNMGNEHCAAATATTPPTTDYRVLCAVSSQATHVSERTSV